MSKRVNLKHLNSDIATDTELAAGLSQKYDASNPSGYETPSELDARDVENRQRVNHTGTQLASTISDFASTARSVLMSGISTAVSSAVLATDNLITALGKLQAQINTMYSYALDPSDVGHVSSSGVSSAFARADHSHKIEIDTLDARTSTSSSTMSLTPVAISNVSFALTNPGKYMIIGAAIGENDSSDQGNEYGIYIGGQLLSGTNKTIYRGSNQGDVTLTYSLSIPLEITTTGTVELKVNSTASYATATTNSANLTFIRIG